MACRGVLAGLCLCLGATAWAEPPPTTRHLRIGAASGAMETGIVQFLADEFRRERPDLRVDIQTRGTIPILQLGRGGEVDVVITHHRPSEEQFVEEGYGLTRVEFMADDYLLFGPTADPLKIAQEPDLIRVLQRLAKEQVVFFAPGSASGTTQRLNALWDLAGVKPIWRQYSEAEISAGAALVKAAESLGYALADRGTYLINRVSIEPALAPLYQGHPRLHNVYSAIVVNPHRVPGVQQDLARQFVDFLVSDSAQQLIQSYGESTFGTRLFTALAITADGEAAPQPVSSAQTNRQNLVVNLFLALSAILVALILVAITYVSRYRRAERARRETEERLILAMSGSNDAIWDWNIETDQVYFSTRWKEMLGYIGYNPEIGTTIQDWMSRVHPDDLELTLILLDNYLEGRSNAFVSEHRLRTKRGDYIWVLERAKALWNNDGKPVRLSGSVSNIHERKLQTAVMEHQAFHDLLTDLPNRTLFQDRLQQAILLARRENRSVAVLVLNLNRFREINDTLGHYFGDRVLRQVAGRLRDALQPVDTLGRLGGDEFAVLLPVVEAGRAAIPVQRLLAALDEPFEMDDQTVRVSASVGIALYPEHGEDGETLLQRATVAMYTAKHSLTGHATYAPPSTPETPTAHAE